MFAVQDEMSAAISAALKVRLSPLAPAKQRHTPARPAYEALLKARHFHWQTTPESMNQAKLFHEQAIALDPQYALAHTDYAEFLLGWAVMGLSPMREIASHIRASAQRALELDPAVAEAHAPLCALAATYDYDWHEAGRQFLLAMPGGRGSPLVHHVCGLFYLLGSGRGQEAVEQLERAVQADPLHLTYRLALAASLMAVNRYDEAEELQYQSRELYPNFFWTHLYLAELCTARQMFAEALPFAEKTFSLAPWYAPSVRLYAGLLARAGEPDRGEREIVRALGEAEAYGAAKGLAVFHLVCGDIDATADWYEKAIEERDPEILYFFRSMLGEHAARQLTLARTGGADESARGAEGARDLIGPSESGQSHPAALRTFWTWTRDSFRDLFPALCLGELPLASDRDGLLGRGWSSGVGTGLIVSPDRSSLDGPKRTCS